MPAAQDSIAAIATPPGRGGVGIIRISGPLAPAIAAGLGGKLPERRKATLAKLHDAAGELIDTALLLYFPAPASYTGEDVLELQCHGGPVLMDVLLARVLELGARLARPGEFSERAFLNGKLDLAQAEAVADLIDAGSKSAVRAAQRSLQGEFSQAVHALVEDLTQLRIYVEASIDFPEEEVDFLGDGKVLARVDALDARFKALQRQSEQGRVLRDGLTVVLAGQPNVGKSSLLNALAGTDAAIVTDIPGTTRDVLRERLQVDGLPLHVIDTAGLRASSDPIEQEGMRRAREQIALADHLLLLVDDRDGVTAADAALRRSLPQALSITVLFNKCDLSGRHAVVIEDGIRLSAKSGAGLPLLRDHLKNLAHYQPEEGLFLARRRHVDALARAHAALHDGRKALVEYKAGELLAEELRLAQQALGEITGQVSSDELLGRIFSSFCIGK